MMRFLFVLALLLLPNLAQARVNLAEAPIDRLNLPWWHDRWLATREQAHETQASKIIWLGDSITQNWQWAGTHGFDDFLPVWKQYYLPYDALDFGFKGDTTANLIWRLDHGQLAGLHPDLAIILIGANNFGRVHWDAQMTVPGIESVVRITARKLPGTHILLLGVLPSIRSPWVDDQTAVTNAALARAYAANGSVTFMDLTHLFLVNGKVDAGFYIDPHLLPPNPPLHPNSTSMARIAVAIEPVVHEFVK